MHLLHQASPIAGVLRDAMREHVVEVPGRKRQRLAVGDQQVGVKVAMSDVLARQRNRRVCNVDAGHARAAARKPHEIHSRPTAEVEHVFARQPVKWHQAKQVVELVEVVLVEIVEEPG